MVANDGDHRGQGPRGRREDEFGPGTGNPNSPQQTHAHFGKHRLSDPHEQYWKPAQTINVLSAMGLSRRRPNAGVVMRISGYRVLLSFFVVAAVAAVPARTRAQSEQSAAPEHVPGPGVSRKKGSRDPSRPPDRARACHNGLETRSGEDISIGINWRTSIMANSARDPYWMGGGCPQIHEHPHSSHGI